MTFKLWLTLKLAWLEKRQQRRKGNRQLHGQRAPTGPLILEVGDRRRACWTGLQTHCLPADRDNLRLERTDPQMNISRRICLDLSPCTTPVSLCVELKLTLGLGLGRERVYKNEGELSTFSTLSVNSSQNDKPLRL